MIRTNTKLGNKNLQEQVRKASLPRAGIAVWPVVHSIDAYRELSNLGIRKKIVEGIVFCCIAA